MPHADPGARDEAMDVVMPPRSTAWTTYAGIGVAALSGIGLVAVILSQLGGPPQLTKGVHCGHERRRTVERARELHHRGGATEC